MSQVTHETVLGAIRAELDQIKVPGALDAQPETTWADLDVDSLDLVELVKALEDRFNVEIGDGDLKSIASVGDVINLVLSLDGARAAA
jgi:acyl carrier protein